MNVHLEKIAVVSSLSVARLRIENFQGEQKNVTIFRDFIFILSVRLCSRFIAGVQDIIRT